ncbi:clorobiocin biosynthesis protein Clo-hal [Verrucomicrobium sp. GAS474]|uniref:NAD(P)/FAD-dependent oxidoreductase n=1 Tax=Verrucomicrobium sp. GAS474 TaxID=1882831 RepID=UPI00087B346F|nr:NAD(P)/FAD-dependent oxidoreductase [Verrucomicrobium sp. GAS474]SDU05049.1 clorobiocin biosynthesis protein Clo-hal [Verrucomicrobium sp. GAS474]
MSSASAAPSPAPAHWDLVVIGGGPAGSTAAALLAAAGKKVLVLEREAFPRFHIGESLLPYGNDVLKELGLWEKLHAGGFMPKYGAEFTLGNAAGIQRFLFRRNLAPEYGQTFQVERAKFDHLLLQNAEEKGAVVLQQSKVTSLATTESGATVTYEREGASATVTASWLLDASGRTALLGNALKLPKDDLGMRKKIAVFSHFKGVYRNEGEAAGHITIVRLEDAWCWFIPLDAEKTSVGLVQYLDAFKAAGRTPEESFHHAVSAHTELRFRLKDAARLRDFHTEGEYTFRFDRAAGPRWLLAGDAAGFIDPIFSSGVMVALRSSQLAAKAILKADADAVPRGLTGGEQRRYTREVKKMTTTFLNMIRMFYDRSSFEVFMAPRAPAGLLRAVLHLVAGDTNLSWPIRWRVRAFYALCRLQRHRAIAPRLTLLDGRAAEKEGA